MRFVPLVTTQIAIAATVAFDLSPATTTTTTEGPPASSLDPLFIPCAGKLATEIADKAEYACAGGRLSAIRFSNDTVVLEYRPTDQSGHSADKLTTYATAVMPNLGVPAFSLGGPHRAESSPIARLFEKIGGPRNTTWRFPNAVVDVDNFILLLSDDADERQAAFFTIAVPPVGGVGEVAAR
jgi:hypothetical protein